MTPEISVVVGSTSGGATLSHCLEVISRQKDAIRAEIFVIVPEDAAPFESYGAEVLRLPGRPLVPELWAAGIERAVAPLVAVLSGQCIPGERWLEEILRLASEQPPFAGYGGPIEPPEGGSRFDWAMYFSRYSAYMPPMREGPADEIAGDNATYRRDMLDRYWTHRVTGFWETLFHHALRGGDEKLLVSNDVRVQLGSTAGHAAFLRMRLRHGLHFGSTRPDNTPLRRSMRFALAPLLVPVLVARIGGRVRGRGQPYSGKYLRAFPWLLLILSSWSLGEALGYLRGK